MYMNPILIIPFVIQEYYIITCKLIGNACSFNIQINLEIYKLTSSYILCYPIILDQFNVIEYTRNNLILNDLQNTTWFMFKFLNSIVC